MDQLRSRLSVQGLGTACAVAALCVQVACSEPPAGESRRAVSSRATSSAGEGGAPVSLDSALRLFRGTVDSVARLENGEPSMDALMQRFEQTVAASDTARLRSLVMTRREFAYLYYPSSVFTRPPTKQEPALAWFLHLQQSQKGATRLLNRFGGRPFRIVKNECRGAARVEGANTLWNDCLQTAVSGRDTVRMRLMGGIYERDGVYKLLSYANDM